MTFKEWLNCTPEVFQNKFISYMATSDDGVSEIWSVGELSGLIATHKCGRERNAYYFGQLQLLIDMYNRGEFGKPGSRLTTNFETEWER